MGIDSKIFVNISEHLICPVCLDVFDDPTTALCGHTCCYSCWYSLGKQSLATPKEIKCPSCRQCFQALGLISFSTFIVQMTGKTMIHNYTIKNIIDNWLTACPRSGCQEVVSFSLRDAHYADCVDGPTTGYFPLMDFVSHFDQDGADDYSPIEWCARCGIGFGSLESLNQHIIDEHQDSEEIDENVVMN